jgi:hypothetical protein
MLWLGHDGPEYFISEDFLLEIGHCAWIHCKNLEALEFLNQTFPHLNYFWHQNDDYTMTSCGFIWAYPGVDPGKNGVLVMPEVTFSEVHKAIEAYDPKYVCSDYVFLL